MARRVQALIPAFEGFELLGLVSRIRPENDPATEWFGSLEDADASADLLIDFTLPGGARVAANWCAANEVAILSGTTGLTGDDISALEGAASKVPVLWAPNLSEGVALMTALVRQAACSLSVDAKVSISDIHHQHKKDAPSGTALALSAAIMEARPKVLSAPSATEGDEPAFSCRREGEVIGEHTVSFELPDEVIEITHRALNRDVFARGALKAGKWLVAQTPGYYSTSDWLGLR
jgi:4-hydroxy-tetrahydrodipicolinate reductase